MICQNYKKYYPTFVMENFFENPDEIIKYSNTCEFFPPEENHFWPGQRTKSFHLFNKSLFNFVIEKLLSVYYDNTYHNLKCEKVEIMFHKISSKDWSSYIKKDIRIHRDDDNELSALIYLNKKIFNEETGTSLYDDEKNRIIKISNKFNNLACYDAKKLHGITNFNNFEEDRLTVVIFIGKIEIKKNVNERINDLGKSYTVQK
jgi:hypothetical protein